MCLSQEANKKLHSLRPVVGVIGFGMVGVVN